MYKIAIIEKIHDEGLKLLDEHKDLEYELITDTSEENLIKKLPEFDGCTLRVSKLSAHVLTKCKKLRVISRHGVGYDNVDLDYIKTNNITLMITATANATAVAEHVIYMMMSIAKGKMNYDNEVRNGNFKKNANTISTFELMDKEILIAGFGRIGKNLIKKCIGLDMKIKIYDPFVDKSTIKDHGGQKIDNLEEGLTTCDFLSIHMPLNQKTKNLINYNIMKSMKRNAVIINTARGGIVNEQDLDKALREDLILGAGIDVFEIEPPEPTNPLLKNNKILMSPHTSALTNECRVRMSKETTKNIIDFFNNKINNSMIVKL